MEQNRSRLSTGIAILILIGILALCVVSYIYIDDRIQSHNIEMVDTTNNIRNCVQYLK